MHTHAHTDTHVEAHTHSCSLPSVCLTWAALHSVASIRRALSNTQQKPKAEESPVPFALISQSAFVSRLWVSVLCSFPGSKNDIPELTHGATCTVPLARVCWYVGNVFADAALERKACSWRASAVITRFMWDGRNSMLGDCNSNKTQRWNWFYYTANACI